MAPIVIKDGKAVSTQSQPKASVGLGGLQKAGLVLAAVLVGPSLLLQLYEKVSTEEVDLSQFNMVTSYEKPAIEMMDSVVRIQYCASWKVNGQFRRCALELQQDFPGLKLEGGPFTPSAKVQYAIKAVRVGQVAVGLFFIFGEQILALLGMPPFEFMAEMGSNMLYHAGALYGLNCVVSMLKSINAFEVTYNGEVVYSKLSSGEFPSAGELSKKLREVKQRETSGRSRGQ